MLVGKAEEFFYSGKGGVSGIAACTQLGRRILVSCKKGIQELRTKTKTTMPAAIPREYEMATSFPIFIIALLYV